MASNGISTLEFKRDRVIAKLDLAEAKRIAASKDRPFYDLTLLPTLPGINSNNSGDIVDNANVGGLQISRPWVAPAAGLYRRTYSGYFDDDPAWFASATQTAETADSTLAIASIPTTTSVQYVGYFVPSTTETYTFFTTSDDASYLWIGDAAATGFTTGNAVVDNGGVHGPQERSGTVSLEAGRYYPIRIQVGNNEAGGLLSVSFSTPSIAKTSTFTDRVFHNSVSEGL